MNKNILIVLLLTLAIVCIVFNDNITDTVLKNTSVQKTTSKSLDNSQNQPKLKGDSSSVQVNSPTDFDYMSKDEIYNIRKYYVKNSIFEFNKYEPSEDVFGQIIDNKPWVQTNICKNTKIEGYKKASEEARFINNPSIPVAIEYPFVFNGYPDEDWCIDPINNMIPESINFDGLNKIVTVTYNRLPFVINDTFSFYTFNGLNARDLGYKYAYIDNSKSTYKINFSNSDNISTQVTEFQNFIHLGSSCGVEGGCNNGSPRQPLLEFKQYDTDFENLDGEIYIKLWKKYPTSPEQEPDLVEKIILKEY